MFDICFSDPYGKTCNIPSISILIKSREEKYSPIGPHIWRHFFNKQCEITYIQYMYSPLTWK